MPSLWARPYGKSHLSFTATLQGRCFYNIHFRDGDMESQGNYIAQGHMASMCHMARLEFRSL